MSDCNDQAFLLLFKQRVLDEFMQEWRTSINNMEVLTLYKCFKDTVDIEFYLNNIVSAYCTYKDKNICT